MVLSKDDNLSKGFFSTAEPLVVIVLGRAGSKAKTHLFFTKVPEVTQQSINQGGYAPKSLSVPFTNHF